MVHKPASIHDIIKDISLDIFALQETWISADALPAIKDDIAPAGYSCLHVCRESHGGGLGLIYRNDFFVKQLADIVSAELEKVAPLHTARRRQPKSITRRLSPTAISAKRERRRLETLWMRSGVESDRIAYRHQRRTANKIINQARRDHNSQHISSCTDSKSRWAAVRELLHSSDNHRFTSDEENLKLCDNFSNFFSIKISNHKQSIKAKLGSPIPPPSPDAPFNGTPLSILPSITPAEVSKLLRPFSPNHFQ